MTTKDTIYQPTTLHEAINMIKFLDSSHKKEISKWKKAYYDQASTIKTLEANRKKELEFLSKELHNYEVTLALRSEAVEKELKAKDDIIQKQLQTIEELNRKLMECSPKESVPDITILSVDSNSDSGIAYENDESEIKNQTENTTKEESKTRKCSRRFAESIRFFRRVDFSPRRCKSRDNNKTDMTDSSSQHLGIPVSTRNSSQFSSDISLSDDDRCISTENLRVGESIENIILKNSNAKNDSMNNHFSDDGSEDTSEEAFDRVMTRSSIRRSVKANPKYKKINRTKSKLLEQIKINILD